MGETSCNTRAKDALSLSATFLWIFLHMRLNCDCPCMVPFSTSPFDTHSANGATQYATATFTEAKLATEASKALHGTSVDTWVLKSRSRKKQNMKQSISVLVKQSDASRGTAVKVQWYAPS